MPVNWLPVVGYEGIYEVSDSGAVRSLDRTTMRSNGRPQRWKGKLLRIQADEAGYRCVQLWNKTPRSHFVHRLVAAAFIGPCPDGGEVNHKDGDKSRNMHDNLEYMTPLQNVRHSRDVLGFDNRGERSGMAKLTETEVREIRRLCTQGELQRIVADKFKISACHVSSIVKGQRWAHLSL